MYLVKHARSMNRFAKAAVALEMFLGIGALVGGGILMVAPRGEIIPLPVSVLDGSPFDSYFVPGLILFSVLGLGSFVAAVMGWATHRLAPFAAAIVGVALLIWLAVEIAIIGYTNTPPLQPFYLVLGAAITLVATLWLAKVGPLRAIQL